MDQNWLQISVEKLSNKNLHFKAFNRQKVALEVYILLHACILMFSYMEIKDRNWPKVQFILQCSLHSFLCRIHSFALTYFVCLFIGFVHIWLLICILHLHLVSFWFTVFLSRLKKKKGKEKPLNGYFMLEFPCWSENALLWSLRKYYRAW